MDLTATARPPMTASQEDTAMDTAPVATDVEFISVPEWCRRLGCSLDSGYRAVRREIPGLFRIGRLIRINWPAFVAATTAAGADEAGSGRSGR